MDKIHKKYLSQWNALLKSLRDPSVSLESYLSSLEVMANEIDLLKECAREDFALRSKDEEAS